MTLIIAGLMVGLVSVVMVVSGLVLGFASVLMVVVYLQGRRRERRLLLGRMGREL